MTRLYTNNYSSTLNGAITDVATSIVVTSAAGLPTITGSDFYYLTLDDGAGGVEIVKVTARTTTTLTVVRAQEGTTAQAFADLDTIELRPTAEGLQNPVQYTGEDRAVDLGAAASLEIPNGAAPTVDAAGEIAVDTTITDHTGLITYHDGTEALYAVGLPTANLLSTDGYVVAYNATNNEFEMVAQSGGGGGGTFASLTDITFTTQVDTDDVATFQDVTYIATSNPEAAFGGIELVGTTSRTQYKYTWSNGYPVMLGATGKEVGFTSAGLPYITDGSSTLTWNGGGYIDVDANFYFGSADFIKNDVGATVIGIRQTNSTVGYCAFDCGNQANIYADGTGTDIPISLNPKGAGNVSIFAAGLEFSSDGEGVRDASQNEQLTFFKTASAVNHVSVTNAATAGDPKIAAAGDDTNVNLEVAAKGTGSVIITGDALEIPNSATPTVSSAGEIALDTSVTDYTGLIKYHDGVEEQVVLGMPTANLSTTDGHVVAYNAANNELEMVAQSGGGTDSTVGAFRAYRNGTQALSAATHTKIALTSESFDYDSTFDSTTNYRHTPTTAGKYIYTGLLFFPSPADQNQVITELYLNGVVATQATAACSGTAGVVAVVTDILVMNGTTDYVELYGYRQSAGNIGAGGTYYAYLSATYLGA